MRAEPLGAERGDTAAEKQRQQHEKPEQVAKEDNDERIDVTADMFDRCMHPRKREGGENHQRDAAQTAVAGFVQKGSEGQMRQPY